MDPLDVWTTEGPAHRCVRWCRDGRRRTTRAYLVVDRGRLRPNRCLIPLPVQLDVVHQTLRVDADDLDLDHLPTFDAESLPGLSQRIQELTRDFARVAMLGVGGVVHRSHVRSGNPS